MLTKPGLAAVMAGPNQVRIHEPPNPTDSEVADFRHVSDHSLCANTHMHGFL